MRDGWPIDLWPWPLTFGSKFCILPVLAFWEWGKCSLDPNVTSDLSWPLTAVVQIWCLAPICHLNGYSPQWNLIPQWQFNSQGDLWLFLTFDLYIKFCYFYTFCPWTVAGPLRVRSLVTLPQGDLWPLTAVIRIWCLATIRHLGCVSHQWRVSAIYTNKIEWTTCLTFDLCLDLWVHISRLGHNLPSGVAYVVTVPLGLTFYASSDCGITFGTFPSSLFCQHKFMYNPADIPNTTVWLQQLFWELI